MSVTSATNGHPVNNQTFHKGSSLDVTSGGTASHDTFLAGSSEVVHAGGITSFTDISSGASITVDGVGYRTEVHGTETIGNGGVERGAEVYAGGLQNIQSGGVAQLDRVQAGGIVFAEAGARVQNIDVMSGGRVTAAPGATFAGLSIVDGGGTIFGAVDLANNATLELAKGAAAGDVVLDGKNDTLQIDAIGTHIGTVENFGLGDALDMSFLKFSANDSYTTAGDTVTFSDGSKSYSINIAGASTDHFMFSNDGTGHTDVTVCYYPGTLIRTPHGDVAVEGLAIGDQVIKADGGVATIRWMGRNTVSTRFADPMRALPIRIMAGALGNSLPERDLLVSPQHAIEVDGVLIQAAALINGISIVRESNVPEVFVYHHVELADHALILAEGTPSETFVDNIDRMAFDNWAEHEALYAAAPIDEMPLPRAKSARQVPSATRARLLAVAASGSFALPAGMAA